jgi:hypothetical protein
MERKIIAKSQPRTFLVNNKGERIACWFIENDEVYIIPDSVRGWGSLRNHSINEYGQVDPSVLIKGMSSNNDDNEAEYHEYVILDDWNPNCYKIAEEQKVRYNL